MAVVPAKVLPSKAVNCGVHSAETKGLSELYPTPPELTAALLHVERLPSVLWEPAAGQGHMTDVLLKHGHTVYSSDMIDYGRGYPLADFLKTKALPKRGIEGIITNPPFSIASEFVRHALSLVPAVYILGRLAFLETRRRSDILDVNLARVYPFVERPPMMHRHTLDPVTGLWTEWAGKKASSAMPVAWFVFRRDHDARRMGTQLKRLSWKSPKTLKSNDALLSGAERPGSLLVSE